jgi:hypothetical protein
MDDIRDALESLPWWAWLLVLGAGTGLLVAILYFIGVPTWVIFATVGAVVIGGLAGFAKSLFGGG